MAENEHSFDRSRADRVLAFVQFMHATSGRYAGKPLRLMDWQQDAISRFFGEVRYDQELGRFVRRFQYLYLEMPKKNGKTEIAAALGLYMLTADGELNGEVYICAADKANAGICFAAAKFMVEESPELSARIRIVDSSRKMIDIPTGSILQVLSSEAYSKHGYKPSCVIFDELHAQPNRDLWDVMTFGAGDAREEPVWIVLTTAGKDPDRGSIGWEVHEKAVRCLRARGFTFWWDDIATKPDEDGNAVCAPEDLQGKPEDDLPDWLPIVYGMPDNDLVANKIDITDERIWTLCNPSAGKTVRLSTIRKEAQEAKKSEKAEFLFRWLRLNQWVAIDAVGWIPITVYDRTQWHGNVEDLRGLTCYAGVDLSSTTDLTAVVLTFPVQPGLDVEVALQHGWRPQDGVDEAEKHDHAPYRDWARSGFITLCDGNIIDYTSVENYILDAATIYHLKLVGFDPYLSRTITQRIASLQPPPGACTDSINCVEIPQNIQTMSPVMKDMEIGMREKRILHVHNTAGRWCFNNVRVVTDGNENLKPTKKKSRGRIDMTVAWIISRCTMALAPKPTLAETLAAGDWTM